MKNKNLIQLFILLNVVVLFLLNSCSKCTEIYKTTEMKVNCNADSLDTIKYSTLYILIEFNFDYENMCVNNKTDTKWKNHIKTFSITSNNDYNDNFKKGDNLTDIIEMTYLKKPGNFWNEDTIIMNDYFISNSECFLNARLIFISKPGSTRLHNLIFNYKETDDSTEYKFETVPFYITP